MEFFATPIAAFLTIAAIAAGFGLVLVAVVVWYTTRVDQMRMEINLLQAQVKKLQEILILKYPNEYLAMTIHGDVVNSDVVTAGRDGSIK